MTYTVTLIPGDGTGPELAQALETVIAATGVPIEWERQDAGVDVMEKYGTPLPEQVLESVRRNKVAIKGPITTPVGTGFRSVNVALRKELDLYACLRPAKSLVGVRSRYSDIDLVIVRENTEDLYAGIEHMVGADAAESIKIITRKGTERIARFAFEYARKHGRRKVTAVHKANIMKCTDGLFLRVAREVAEKYPGHRVRGPHRRQHVHAARAEAGAVRRARAAQPLRRYRQRPLRRSDRRPGRRAGRQHRRHGGGVRAGARQRSQVRRPGQGEPDRSAALSGVLMLEHLGEVEAAQRMHAAIAAVIAEGKDVTYDLGGSAGTQQMAAAIAAPHLS